MAFYRSYPGGDVIYKFTGYFSAASGTAPLHRVQHTRAAMPWVVPNHKCGLSAYRVCARSAYFWVRCWCGLHILRTSPRVRFVNIATLKNVTRNIHNIIIHIIALLIKTENIILFIKNFKRFIRNYKKRIAKWWKKYYHLYMLL